MARIIYFCYQCNVGEFNVLQLAANNLPIILLNYCVNDEVLLGQCSNLNVINEYLHNIKQCFLFEALLVITGFFLKSSCG